VNSITLYKTLPKAFEHNDKIISNVWLSEVKFTKNKSYLIQAKSGCGKTSLCSFLYGQRNDYIGDILFNDKNITRLTPIEWDNIRRKHISILFQDLKLFPELSALENIILKNNLTKFKTIEEIKTLFYKLELIEKIEHPISKLSLGQQQRVAFIRAICQPFDFIILDEPISHIDNYNAELIKQILIEECQTQQAGIIATSIGNHLNIDYNEILQL
jgi:ABC-type lipoprotein export system ATPase subunit